MSWIVDGGDDPGNFAHRAKPTEGGAPFWRSGLAGDELMGPVQAGRQSWSAGETCWGFVFLMDAAPAKLDGFTRGDD